MGTTYPKTIYLARDMEYHSTKTCATANDAAAYIESFSGKGYIEQFDLVDDYYRFVHAEWVGETNRHMVRGTVFGSDIPEGIHKNFIPFVLGHQL